MSPGNANECTNKLKACENKLLTASQELRDYKEKAGRILQAKEKVITSLKVGKAIVGDSSGVTGAEYEVVCQERDVFRDELQQLKYSMEQLKVDVQVYLIKLQKRKGTSIFDSFKLSMRRHICCESELFLYFLGVIRAESCIAHLCRSSSNSCSQKLKQLKNKQKICSRCWTKKSV